MRLKVTLLDGDSFFANVAEHKAVGDYTLFFIKSPPYHGKFILTSTIREITEVPEQPPQETFIPVSF